MKKNAIYVLIAAVIVVFGALTAVYQIRHPGRMIPVSKYTELKVSFLGGTNFHLLAEELQIPENKRGSTVYAAIIEYPTPQLEAEKGVTAGFYFFDLNGIYARVYTNAETITSSTDLSELALRSLQSAAALYDETYTLAENTDYGIPDYGCVKVYLRRGDGVYFRVFKDAEVPAAVSSILDEFGAAVAQYEEKMNASE
ncbi:MAG: hypothetical protein J5585_08045 [Clostridia bacterium]|nr:hypothetical protein [Clostridia bacterium]